MQLKRMKRKRNIAQRFLDRRMEKRILAECKPDEYLVKGYFRTSKFGRVTWFPPRKRKRVTKEFNRSGFYRMTRAGVRKYIQPTVVRGVLVDGSPQQL